MSFPLFYVIPVWINFTSVIPWLDHGVHKNNKNTNNFSIFNWIPWSSHGMTISYDKLTTKLGIIDCLIAAFVKLSSFSSLLSKLL